MAQTQLQAQEVHIPLHNSSGEMDQNGQRARPEALHAEGLFATIDLIPTTKNITTE